MRRTQGHDLPSGDESAIVPKQEAEKKRKTPKKRRARVLPLTDEDFEPDFVLKPESSFVLKPESSGSMPSTAATRRAEK
jgi:hypothetical protein